MLPPTTDAVAADAGVTAAAIDISGGDAAAAPVVSVHRYRIFTPGFELPFAGHPTLFPFSREVGCVGTHLVTRKGNDASHTVSRVPCSARAPCQRTRPRAALRRLGDGQRLHRISRDVAAGTASTTMVFLRGVFDVK